MLLPRLGSKYCLPAKDVYRMATSLGAAAMGLKDAGRLEPGCLADLITIDLDTPTPVNEYNVYDQIILFRNPANVRDVMVNGQFLKRNGKLLTLDEIQVKQAVYEAAQDFWKRQG